MSEDTKQKPLEALNRDGWGPFFHTTNPVCPHCGTEADMSKNEWWRLYEEGTHEVTCPYCDIDYSVATRVTYRFDTDTQP